MEALAAQSHRIGEPPQPPRRYLHLVQNLVEAPPVLGARDMEFEPAAQEAFAQWRGALAIRDTVEPVAGEAEPVRVDLLERLKAAKAGDAEALKSIDINIATATTEGVFKKDHVSKPVKRVRNADGKLTQFGQSDESVYANAITDRPNRHSILQEITEAEALNGQRLQHALDAGILKDYVYVVASIVPNDVPEKDLGHKGDGYFLEDLTFVLQGTTEMPNGEVETESAFMAGVEGGEQYGFEERMARRHDIKALGKLYEKFKQEAPTTAAEFLQNGVFIPKSMMPNRIVDVMRMVDVASDEVQGREVERKEEDYTAKILESRRREASLKDVQLKVREEFLAASESLGSAMDASKQMWELVKKHTVEASYTNLHIDPRAFGQAAAPTIGKIRQSIKDGASKGLEALKRRAQEEAMLTGCGGGAGGGGGRGRGSNAQAIANSPEDDRGHTLFECGNGHLNERPYDGDDIPNCTTCGIAVSC